MSRPRHRVVITGLGPIAACGIGKAAFLDALRRGQSGITAVTRFDASPFHAKCAGEVRDFDPAAFFPTSRLKRLDRYSQFAVASALLALEDAGLPWSRKTPQDRVGVSFGTALGGISDAENEHRRFLDRGIRGVNPSLALQIFGGAAHSNIALECGFQGVGTTNANSCASGVIAVGEALRYLREGWADVVIAGGSEAPLNPLTFGAFDTIKTMSRWQGEPPLACRPFDLHRDGFVMGEGAGSLVMETLEHATRRGVRIYAEVTGYGLTNDAFHMTTPCPDGASVSRCMSLALADAGVAPEAIGYINGHASSTQLNDANETACIRRVFGAHADRLAVSGTKPFTAHPLGATGALETIICALALSEAFLPPTLHYRTPDPACDLDVIPNEGRSRQVDAILKNAFGFGGINASLVLERGA